jgi:diguanylate cyclase (GGDEF)-like protein
MDLVMAQYLEVNLIGTVVLLTLLFYLLRMHENTRRTGRRDFMLLLLCNIVILLTDAAIAALRGWDTPALVALNHGMCCVYFIGHPAFGYLWLYYSVRNLFPEYQPSRGLQMLLRLPFLAACALILASPRTGWVYYLAAGNEYHRGPLMWAVVALSYLYWAVSLVLALREWYRPSRVREANVYGTLLFFPLPTLVGNVIQLRYYGLSVVWICAAISLLVLFVNLQNEQVSRDMLTGLFNRRQADLHLTWELAHLPAAEESLFVAMVDVDHFKRINDQFGHLEGDRALIAVADILKRSCRRQDFVARFGGDEFLLTGHAADRAGVAALIGRIRDAVERYNRTEGAPYTLSLSVGATLCGREDLLTPDKLVMAADREMYREKSEKHAARPE